eukprot:scaffold7703_cov103-Isochrysis_galbana.AAC.7
MLHTPVLAARWASSRAEACAAATAARAPAAASEASSLESAGGEDAAAVAAPRPALVAEPLPATAPQRVWLRSPVEPRPWSFSTWLFSASLVPTGSSSSQKWPVGPGSVSIQWSSPWARLDCAPTGASADTTARSMCAVACRKPMGESSHNRRARALDSTGRMGQLPEL